MPFWGFGIRFKKCKLLFSMFPLILTLDFLIILGSTHQAETLLFSVLPSIIKFVFDLIQGSFYFLGPKWAIFGSQGKFQKLFWGLLM